MAGTNIWTTSGWMQSPEVHGHPDTKSAAPVQLAACLTELQISQLATCWSSVLKLFLAALVVGFTITAATPFGEESERIIEETDLVVNGDLVHEQRETDGSCRQVKNTATLSDGSSSISYEDFEAGLELVTISNDTGTCFVKEISQDKKDEAETCKNGRVQRSEDQPDQEEEDLVEGPEVSAEDLSPRLRALCEGRKIVRMVPANTTQQSDDTGSDVDGKRRFIILASP
ncbi:hypothetical protein BaRGS_00007959 [Batillaria attramentaria]|uniref:Uncharacterized protein n=1 Tax=Batillaria attramentaria TaxID=370345 RepID=A0ABD0LNG2_9CAEN